MGFEIYVTHIRNQFARSSFGITPLTFRASTVKTPRGLIMGGSMVSESHPTDGVQCYR